MDWQNYPTAQFSFVLTLDDDPTEYGFHEVSGLTTETDFEQSVKRSASERYKLPGQIKNQNLTIRRGAVGAKSDLLNWCRDTIEFDRGTAIQTRTLLIGLRDESGRAAFAWRAKQAWPVNWRTSSLMPSGTDFAIESIEFAHVGIERVS